MSKTDWGNICDRADTCAQTGAAAFFGGIKNAQIMLNGPLWCYFYATRHLEQSHRDMGERFHGSQPDNTAVVYGTEKFLLEALENLKANDFHPDVLLIENSCAMGLIGDDLSGIAKKAKLDFPVLTMDSGGSIGGFAEGYSKAALTLLKSLELKKAASPNPLCVNLLGATDFYYNGKADTREIMRLLHLSGCEVNCVLGAGSDLSSIRQIGRASLNIVIHAELGLKIASYLQEQLGQPYIVAGMPYGTSGTMDWLKKISEAVPLQTAQAESEADEKQSYLTSWTNEMRCVWGELWLERVIAAAPAATALGIAQALRSEWLDTGELTVICQNDIDIDLLPHDMADTIYIAGKDSQQIEKLLGGFDSGLLLAGSNETSVMTRNKRRDVISCNIAFPVRDEMLLTDTPFCGIRGSAHMVQRLWNKYIAYKAERNFHETQRQRNH